MTDLQKRLLEILNEDKEELTRFHTPEEDNDFSKWFGHILIEKWLRFQLNKGRLNTFLFLCPLTIHDRTTIKYDNRKVVRLVS